jgi:hypothetical protein
MHSTECDACIRLVLCSQLNAAELNAMQVLGSPCSQFDCMHWTFYASVECTTCIGLAFCRQLNATQILGLSIPNFSILINQSPLEPHMGPIRDLPCRLRPPGDRMVKTTRESKSDQIRKHERVRGGEL